MSSTPDPIFEFLEQQHGPGAWGRVLDAGTGVHSLRWVSSLPGVQWTAVTADEDMKRRVLAESGATGGDVVLGTWENETLLQGQRFDVVVADYLLGAVDAFTPYFAERLFARLKPHVAGTLMVVGLEPWGPAQNPAQEAFMDLVRLRDACMLLAGARPYREYPLELVMQRLERSGFRIVETRLFPIRITRNTVDRQVRNATRQLCCVAPVLRKPLEETARNLQSALHGHAGDEGFEMGADHAVVAAPT